MGCNILEIFNSAADVPSEDVVEKNANHLLRTMRRVKHMLSTEVSSIGQGMIPHPHQGSSYAAEKVSSMRLGFVS